jgi:Domain of unknown function (DUF4365)
LLPPETSSGSILETPGRQFWRGALVLPITEQHTEESLCFAHIYALAGIAGVNYTANRYDYGVDGRFTLVTNRGSRRVNTGFDLDYQAKATVNWELVDGNILYDLEAKTYNDFVSRTPAEATMILILLCLPKERNAWHGTSCDETILRHCCYWHHQRRAHIQCFKAENLHTR